MIKEKYKIIHDLVSQKLEFYTYEEARHYLIPIDEDAGGAGDIEEISQKEKINDWQKITPQDLIDNEDFIEVYRNF